MENSCQLSFLKLKAKLLGILVIKNIQHGENYATIKQDMLVLICKALDERFDPTEKDPLLLAAAKLTDFNDWPMDIQNLATFGQEQLNLLLQHFRRILNRRGCDMEVNKNEWTDFKAYIYRHLSTYILKTRFKNLLFLLEIIPVFLSSAACEHGFIAVKRIKSDWRRSSQPDMLWRLMLIVIEGPYPSQINMNSVFIRRVRQHAQKLLNKIERDTLVESEQSVYCIAESYELKYEELCDVTEATKVEVAKVSDEQIATLELPRVEQQTVITGAVETVSVRKWTPFEQSDIQFDTSNNDEPRVLTYT
ncbi:unnamed protein product [Mytilus coruscus]|uniref:HAT C-terminal dimerisation domain-containing protein n=1 Tax=Mytilus coruscus TaxID=42192 RepID=A0A6J8DCI2_MYTCO|nr:unnamed protein product [Mytilus coruscus]